MGWFRRRSRFAGVDFLDLVPERMVASEEDPQSRDVVLLMPRFLGTFYYHLLQRFVNGPKRFIRVPLEARGTVLWRGIDGVRAVRDLLADFVAAFPDEDDPAERVCQYVYQLEQNRFVRFLNFPR
jgi:hypothetical protein